MCGRENLRWWICFFYWCVLWFWCGGDVCGGGELRV